MLSILSMNNILGYYYQLSVYSRRDYTFQAVKSWALLTYCYNRILAHASLGIFIFKLYI